MGGARAGQVLGLRNVCAAVGLQPVNGRPMGLGPGLQAVAFSPGGQRRVTAFDHQLRHRQPVVGSHARARRRVVEQRRSHTRLEAVAPARLQQQRQEGPDGVAAAAHEFGGEVVGPQDVGGDLQAVHEHCAPGAAGMACQCGHCGAAHARGVRVEGLALQVVQHQLRPAAGGFGDALVTDEAHHADDLPFALGHVPGAQHAGLVEPLGGQAACTGQDAVGAILGHLAHQPGGVDGPLHGLAGLGRAHRQGTIRHIETRAPAGLQMPQGDQPVVGLDHGEAGNTILIGELTDGRQPRSRPEDAVIDARADGGDDLVHKGRRAVGREDDLQHGVFRCIGRGAGPIGLRWPVRKYVLFEKRICVGE